MTRPWFCGTVAAILIGAMSSSVAVAAREAPATWDGLVAVQAKRMDAVYLIPGADFRAYTKVMFNPTEVAFRRDWLRDYDMSAGGLSLRITDADVQQAFETIRTKFGESVSGVYSGAGYQVVTTPGPDVLRVRTSVINLSVSAPNKFTAARTRAYAREAGEATLVIEARDSQNGAMLGRAVDRRLAGDTYALMRKSVTNRSDFSSLFADWAEESAAGLTELKASSAADVASLKK